MKRRSWAMVSIVGLAALVVAPGLSHACAVCYGAADSPLTEGVNNGILLLLAVIAVVQLGFIALFVSIRRRALQERRRRENFQWIRGGAG